MLFQSCPFGGGQHPLKVARCGAGAPSPRRLEWAATHRTHQTRHPPTLESGRGGEPLNHHIGHGAFMLAAPNNDSWT